MGFKLSARTNAERNCMKIQSDGDARWLLFIFVSGKAKA